jgi:hypothetical protein
LTNDNSSTCKGLAIIVVAASRRVGSRRIAGKPRRRTHTSDKPGTERIGCWISSRIITLILEIGRVRSAAFLHSRKLSALGKMSEKSVSVRRITFQFQSSQIGRLPIEVAVAHAERETVHVLFPMTQRYPVIHDWSVAGVVRYVNSAAYNQQVCLC